MSWYTFLPVRDGAKTISRALDSLLAQTLKPEKIIIVDDGSTDGTIDICQDYQKKNKDIIEIIQTNNKTRDYLRLASLFNLGLRKGYDYHMEMNDDVIFTPDYAETLIKNMKKDNVVVASGRFVDIVKAPGGGGKFVDQEWFFKTGPGCYYELCGSETEILFRAMITGRKYKVYDMPIEHLNPLGYSHGFVGWGYGMRCLGFWWVYALGRCIHERKFLGAKGAWYLFYNYITFKEDGKYLRSYPKEVTDNVKKIQKQVVKQYLKKKIPFFKYDHSQDIDP